MLTVLSLVAACFAIYGSALFVNPTHEPERYVKGAKMFLIGNATTIALGLHIGDLVLVSAQLGLVWFTLPMYENKRFSLGCLSYFAILLLALGTPNEFHFTAHYLGASASIIAIYGAWLMSKYRFIPMAWCWLIADLIFIYVAILNNLPILGVLAAIFVYHSLLRIFGCTRTGLFTFTR